MYRGQRHAGRPGVAVALPEPADVGQMVVRGATYFARRNPIITGSYFLGLLVMILIGGGTKLTYDQRREYNAIMNTIDLQAEFDATNNYYHATEAYRRSQGWFHFLTGCRDDRCERNKRRMEEAKYRMEMIQQDSYARTSDAKSVAGLFSEIGVGEVQDSFWSYFNQGKQFAKRQTMWDAMFIGMRSMGRDENLVKYGLKVLLNLLLNFSWGLIMALVFFVVSLWGIVRSYQPNFIVALVFFALAVCAAFAFVATYLMAMYGAAAGGLYGVLKVAEANRNARLGGPGQRPAFAQRAHYD